MIVLPEEQRRNRRVLQSMLRSGAYVQTEGQLRMVSPDAPTGYAYCWAGVACDVYKRVRQFGFWSGHHFIVELPDGEYEECAATLPEAVRHWYGFRMNTGDYEGAAMPTYPGMGSLTDDNDHGTSLGRIADIIESEPAGLIEA